jgi:predicted Zn-ribbon and HTH transcriptional regulator
MKKTIQMFVESKPEIEIDSTEKCVCHNCGYEQEKMDNIKCGSIICPDCGMPL